MRLRAGGRGDSLAAMDSSAFLASVEALTHRERLGRVVEMGRALRRNEADARATVEALAKSAAVYERLLALLSVYGSNEGERVVEALSDASRTLRRRASRMVAVFCDDAQAERALAAIVERPVLRRTLAQLNRRRRLEPVDAFLSRVLKEAHDPHIVDLLPLGSERVITDFLAEAEQRGGPSYWSRLAIRHARFAAAWFLADLQRIRAIDARQRHRLFPLLPTLARRAPDATLALMGALFDLGEDPGSFSVALARLVRARPRETFELLKARHQAAPPMQPRVSFGGVNFDEVVRALGAERLDYLVRNAWHTLGDGKRGVRWFLDLGDADRRAVLEAFLHGGRGAWGAFLFRYVEIATPEQRALRERAFERWSRAAQSHDGTIVPAALDWLPRELREVEARRHLERCDALVARPHERIVYARLLPFADAREVLAPFLGHPEGEERARAQRILIACALHDHAAISEVIDNVHARKFDQDPVRRAMLEALGALPVVRFTAALLPAVGEVVQDALDAADLSGVTGAAVERLVVRLFRLDGPWGARWLARLFAVRGGVSTWGLGDGLTGPEAARLAPALAELAEGWATRERASQVISLAQSLGIRLGVVTPLLDALERLARDLPFVGVSAMALGLLGKRDRPRFSRLIPELMHVDQSFVLLPVVARFVSVQRQDLLGPLLAHEAMTGRFASGRTHWVIDFGGGYGRWTTAQQAAYAAGLVGLLAGGTEEQSTQRFVVTNVVRLAFADAALVLPFAADPRKPLQEMAIRALPHLDARQGVATLIEALGDARARWAIYALRKVFSEMRPGEVLVALRAVPRTKVTVAKEVVRLLGEMGGAAAYQDLLGFDAPTTHRDVRVALLRALWDHLDRPETWAIFERALHDPDWIIASKLADVPLGRLSDEAESRVCALLGTLLGRAEAEARLDLLGRVAGLPLRDGKRALFHRLLTHLGTDAPIEAAQALEAVLRLMRDGEDMTVARRLGELATRRPHLVAFLPVLSRQLGPYRSSAMERIADHLLELLRKDPLTTPHYLALGARVWAWGKLADVLVELSKRDLLHHDAMVAAVAAVRASLDAGLLEERLHRAADPRLRRLGLAALVELASPEKGWTRERRARLSQYRADPSPAVAGPASFVFPP